MDLDSFTLDGGYIIMNNTWNRQATTGPHKQRIFLKDVNGKTTFGWNWQWGPSTNVVSYPEVLYGDSPWDTYARSAPGIPFLAGAKEVTVDFAVDLEATGIWEAAFYLRTESLSLRGRYSFLYAFEAFNTSPAAFLLPPSSLI